MVSFQFSKLAFYKKLYYSATIEKLISAFSFVEMALMYSPIYGATAELFLQDIIPGELAR